MTTPGSLRPVLTCALLVAATTLPPSPWPAIAQNPNSPGILEPVLSATTGTEVRIPHTDQVNGGQLMNVIGSVSRASATNTTSLLGHPITLSSSPGDDLRNALDDLQRAASDGDVSGMSTAADELMEILLGTTQGRIYDGFAMLNHHRGAFLPDHVPDEYKMKALRDTGLTEPGIDGQPRRIWELDVSLLYYDGQIDSDTFLMRVPVDVHEHDTVRINYTIYSLVTEDFSPTVVMTDHRLPGCVQFPFKGFDSVWEQLSGDEVTRLTVALPPNRLLRGVYTWGWRIHPPRIQFLQPVWEMVNAHTGAVQLEPEGQSRAFRNAQITLEDIGDAAPEKKMWIVADAALTGTPASTIDQWMNGPDQGPLGTWDEWADLAQDQDGLPQEAWDVLALEGIPPGQFGPYELVTVYMNGEMYGDGPQGKQIAAWSQGDTFQVKLINLDNYTHYFRSVDFGPRLTDEIDLCCGSGSHSFEIMNFKPTFGAPKVAEMQWRAGFGFRPHFNIIQQQDLFPRPQDTVRLEPYTGGFGGTHLGYRYSAAARGGDFRFNPPPFIITDTASPAPFPLMDADGLAGLIIGQLTEGYGVAKMCDASEFPLGGFCARDVGPYNPHGVLNIDTDGDDVPDELWFPPFLRNPNAVEGGDIIPPTTAWKPFLWINPNNGTLFIDPAEPAQGYWADLTYAHGAPIPAGGALAAAIEMPRASAQVFYQFDDLFHDNAIFSPHPQQLAPTDVAIEVAGESGARSSGIRLAGIFPNPFHDTTVVEYDVRSAGRVTIDLYDVSGRRVSRQVVRHEAAGRKLHRIDARTASAGVYFVRLTSEEGDHASTKIQIVR